VFAGPAHFKPLLDTRLLERHDFSSMRFACLSGSPLPLELARAVEAKLPGGKTIQLWGMTELQAGSFSRPRDPADVRHSTAGAATPGTELRVVDERLQVRGVSLFSGYLNNEAATREAFTADGWFDTGDTAELTAGCHLRFTGRVKEIINRGGVKYSPVDIEAIIDRMPGVARSAIVPYPGRGARRARLRLRPAGAGRDAGDARGDTAQAGSRRGGEVQMAGAAGTHRNDAAHANAKSDARPPARTAEEMIALYELKGKDDRRYSLFSWRTRMALRHKGIDFESVPVKLSDKAVIEVSGGKTVPVLRDKDTVVRDSWKIAEYLENRYKDAPPLFGGEIGRGVTQAFNTFVDRTLVPAMLPVIAADLHERVDPEDEGYFRETMLEGLP
jgi:acyl-CoA synthetase (AMP-forming)/AMP-acid ligase II